MNYIQYTRVSVCNLILCVVKLFVFFNGASKLCCGNEFRLQIFISKT